MPAPGHTLPHWILTVPGWWSPFCTWWNEILRLRTSLVYSGWKRNGKEGLNAGMSAPKTTEFSTSYLDPKKVASDGSVWGWIPEIAVYILWFCVHLACGYSMPWQWPANAAFGLWKSRPSSVKCEVAPAACGMKPTGTPSPRGISDWLFLFLE